ncbi:hypothetical protein, partial [Corynebacterium casei]|uniref:hypothetical protein n=1 Tax=Corynebacterium casei TaxID=160386 RepID=UPI003F9CCCAC
MRFSLKQKLEGTTIMKKFKKFAAVASATALMGAGAMTAPTAFAQVKSDGVVFLPFVETSSVM